MKRTKDYVIKTVIGGNKVERSVILIIDDDKKEGSVYVELQGQHKGKYVKAIEFTEKDNAIDLPEAVFQAVKMEDETLAGLLYEKRDIE